MKTAGEVLHAEVVSGHCQLVGPAFQSLPIMA
jgi:hypothetical protein